MSAVSFYYYLQVLKQIYVVERTDETEAPRMGVSWVMQVTLVVLALVVLLLGCVPGAVVSLIESAMQTGGH
jgi:NADH:ubiquinone oxidoreductase subunit 2 (subunit N)